LSVSACPHAEAAQRVRARTQATRIVVWRIVVLQ
jgi:hypothetical protein